MAESSPASMRARRAWHRQLVGLLGLVRRCPSLSLEARAVLAELLELDVQETPAPSQRVLASTLQLRDERAVRMAVRELEDGGFLEVVPRSGRTPAAYSLDHEVLSLWSRRGGLHPVRFVGQRCPATLPDNESRTTAVCQAPDAGQSTPALRRDPDTPLNPPTAPLTEAEIDDRWESMKRSMSQSGLKKVWKNQVWARKWASDPRMPVEVFDELCDATVASPDPSRRFLEAALRGWLVRQGELERERREQGGEGEERPVDAGGEDGAPEESPVRFEDYRRAQ